MSTVELKLSNVNGTPPTILQLTTDDWKSNLESTGIFTVYFKCESTSVNAT